MNGKIIATILFVLVAAHVMGQRDGGESRRWGDTTDETIVSGTNNSARRTLLPYSVRVVGSREERSHYYLMNTKTICIRP